MTPPLGYKHPPNKLYRLRRALYGLKQALRAWFSKFSSVISQQSFMPSSYDSTLFVHITDVDIILLLYVDDMIIDANDVDGIRVLQQFLTQYFEIKIWEILTNFLE